MKGTAVYRYAIRFSYGQPTEGFSYSGGPDRVLTRSATCLAVFGIALSSFSLKQMLTNSTTTNKSSSTIPMRKFY